MFDGFFNLIFGWAINFGSPWNVIAMSFILTFLITIMYKLLTDQILLKELKTQVKNHQKEMKNHKNDPQKMMEIQKIAMGLNMKYMKHSMKPMLYTFIPIILIFGWLSASVAYEPINPDQIFNTTLQFKKGTMGTAEIIIPEGMQLIDNNIQEIKDKEIPKLLIFKTKIAEATWNLKGESGNHILKYKFEDKIYEKPILITEGQKYKKLVKAIKNDKLRLIKINNIKKIYINLPILRLGWLGTYIIFSIIFSMTLRRLLKIY